ncbi:tetratricopeptide repeat protein [Pseudomonas sp. B21-048]|uniref:tetratricopeptide repeat protein n=1 Tax=Pseudomonas sp. B21-048 TaxID=2895490 RepID=UPI0038D502FD
MLQKGRGVDQNDVEARLWYGKSADQGNLFAQTSLAKMHRDGIGGPRDEKLALKLFLESAHAGESNAQFEIGRIYLVGLHGVSPDQKEAESWFKKSNERRRPVAIDEFEGLR